MKREDQEEEKKSYEKSKEKIDYKIIRPDPKDKNLLKDKRYQTFIKLVGRVLSNRKTIVFDDYLKR